MKLGYTRAMVARRCSTASSTTCATRDDPVFGLAVPHDRARRAGRGARPARHVGRPGGLRRAGAEARRRCSARTSRSSAAWRRDPERGAAGLSARERADERSPTPRRHAARRTRSPSRHWRFEIIRDPLWNNIRVDPLALRLVDTPRVPAAALRAAARARLPRLSRRDALALRARARHVPPRAAHARRCFEERGLAQQLDADDVPHRRAAPRCCTTSGTIPFSHALEEIGALHHEEVARPLITSGEVADVLRAGARRRRAGAHHGAHPRRERQPAAGAHLRLARPRQDRVPASATPSCAACTTARSTSTACSTRSRSSTIRSAARRRVGIVREGTLGARVAAVREVPDVPQRVLAPRGAQRDGDVQAPRRRRAARRRARRRRRSPRSPTRDCCTSWRSAPRRRCSPRCASVASTSAPSSARPPSCPPTRGEWIADDRALVVAVEDQLARELGLSAGELLLDYPAKTQMLGLDIPVRAATAPCAASPPRAGRARSTCRSSPRSSTAARAGCACSRLASADARDQLATRIDAARRELTRGREVAARRARTDGRASCGRRDGRARRARLLSGDRVGPCRPSRLPCASASLRAMPR